MSNANNSLSGQLTRKRRKRNLRKCANFERGKCAKCDKPGTGEDECDMKKAASEESNGKSTR